MEKKETKQAKNKKVLIRFRNGKSIETKITDESEIRVVVDKAGYRFPRDVEDYKIN